MKNFEIIYNLYEKREDLHQGIDDTAAAEAELEEALQELDRETMFEIDSLIGRVIRAYEMQGFLFGLNCGRRCQI